MIPILKLIRWPNLVIIVLSMCLILFFIIAPGLGITAFTYGLSTIEFLLLSVSTVLIAIGGYIINDIFDINTDSINKQGNNVIGNKISIKYANILYWASTIVGILSGVLLSYLVNQINFGLIFLLVPDCFGFIHKSINANHLSGIL